MKKRIISLLALNAIMAFSNSFAYDTVTVEAHAIAGDCYHHHGCIAQGWVEADIENTSNMDHTYYIGYNIKVSDAIAPLFYHENIVIKAHQKSKTHYDLVIDAEKLNDNTLYYVIVGIEAKDQTDKNSALYQSGDNAKYKMH